MPLADQHVIFLHGPTATGKSSLALELASRFPIDLISVDSGQVYRGMEIGTARLSEDLLAQFPHHLIGIRDVPEIFSVGDFCTQARFHIDEILSNCRVSYLCWRSLKSSSRFSISTAWAKTVFFR